MRKIFTGIAFGISITAANFIIKKNKEYYEYVAKRYGGKQKWIQMK